MVFIQVTICALKHSLAELLSHQLEQVDKKKVIKMAVVAKTDHTDIYAYFVDKKTRLHCRFHGAGKQRT